MENLMGGGSGLQITSQNIQQSGIVSITNSTFSSNIACFAGAFYLKGLYNLTLKTSQFLNNSARNPDVLKCGIAGVAFLQCNLPFACEFKLLENFFGNNYADYMAPTIFSKSNITDINNLFSNNSDRVNFTNKFSSFPLKINESINETNISSGSFFVLVFYLKDYYNQDFFTFKSSSAVLVDFNKSAPDLIMKNTISLPTNFGVFNFSNLMIIKMPLTSFTLEFRITIFDEISNTEDYFSQKFNFYSRACKVGELMTSDFQCKLCQTTYFSLIDPMQFQNIHKCSKCMANSYCPGGNYLIPLSGYWRFSANTTKIMMCILKDACTGPPNISSTDLFKNYDLLSKASNVIHGECYQGHEGNLCHKCIDGYGKTSSNSVCSACDTIQLISYLKMAGTLIFVLVYSFFSAKALMEMKEKNSIDLIGMISKIVVNHMQKMSIVTAFNFVDFGLQIQNFMSVVNLLSFLNENNISNECLLRNFVTDSENFYIYKVFISIVVPIIESLFCLVILIILRVWIFLHASSSNFNVRRIYLIFLICCYFCYPLVTKCSLSMINCITLDDSKHKYLFSSPNILCWEGIHLKVFIAIGFLGIVVWGLCFPIILAFIVGHSISREKKSEKEKVKFTESIKESAAESQILSLNEPKKPALPESMKESALSLNEPKKPAQLHNSGLYLFFYQDYKKTYYYWESVIFLQKFFLSLLPNMVELIGDTIDTLFVIVMVIYLILLVRVNPYKFAPLNFLEFFSIITTIISRTIMAFIGYYPEKSEVVSIGAVLLIFINSCFFVLALFMIFKYNNWKKLLRKYGKKYKKLKNQLKTTHEFLKKKTRSNLMQSNTPIKKRTTSKSDFCSNNKLERPSSIIAVSEQKNSLSQDSFHKDTMNILIYKKEKNPKSMFSYDSKH